VNATTVVFQACPALPFEWALCKAPLLPPRVRAQQLSRSRTTFGIPPTEHQFAVRNPQSHRRAPAAIVPMFRVDFPAVHRSAAICVSRLPKLPTIFFNCRLAQIRIRRVRSLPRAINSKRNAPFEPSASKFSVGSPLIKNFDPRRSFRCGQRSQTVLFFSNHKQKS